MFEKIKSLVRGEYDEVYEENVMEEETEVEEEPKTSALRPTKFLAIGNDNVKKMDNSYSQRENPKVLLCNPTEFSEAQTIVDSLKNKKIVVVNFANMKECKAENKTAMQCQKEIFDFINGAIYAIEGDIKKISGTIFVLAPPNVDIDTNLKEIEKKGSHRWAI